MRVCELSFERRQLFNKLFKCTKMYLLKVRYLGQDIAQYVSIYDVSLWKKSYFTVIVCVAISHKLFASLKYLPENRLVVL